MRNVMKLAPMLLLCGSLATTAWANGTGCSGASNSSASTSSTPKASCPYVTESSHAKAGMAGQCDGMSKASMAEQCGVKANEAMYSFAVPGAECDHCVNAISKAAMAMKGVRCAHVDLNTRTAYIIADKKVDQKAIAKVIQTAGFKNTYKGTGPKVEAEFAKAMGVPAAKAQAKTKDKA